MARAAAALLSFALASTALEARADDFEEVVAGVTLLGVFAGVDIGFAVHDALLFAERRQPAQPVAIAETAVSGPQTIFLHAVMGVLAHERGDDELKLALMAPTMIVSALTTHGTWSIIRPDESPNVLFGASTIVGINAAWTSVSISNAFDGRMPPAETGVLKMLTTGPTTAWGIAEAVESERFTTGWIALSAWSGALFSYGLAETVWGEEGRDVIAGGARALGVRDPVVGPAALADGATGVVFGGSF